MYKCIYISICLIYSYLVLGNLNYLTCNQFAYVFKDIFKFFLKSFSAMVYLGRPCGCKPQGWSRGWSQWTSASTASRTRPCLQLWASCMSCSSEFLTKLKKIKSFCHLLLTELDLLVWEQPHAHTFSLGFVARDILTGITETGRGEQTLYENEKQIRFVFCVV